MEQKAQVPQVVLPLVADGAKPVTEVRKALADYATVVPAVAQASEAG